MRWIVLLVLGALSSGGGASAWAGSDLETLDYHGDKMRSGSFVTPSLTWASAATTYHEIGFDGTVPGGMVAQPLYWRPPGAEHGYIIAATDQNVVLALDTVTGRPVWQTEPLGPPAIAVTPHCPTKKPTGIAGTPVIDPATGIVYLDANIQVGTASRHLIFGLSLIDGSIVPGWPIDVGNALAAIGITFQPEYQGQHGGLALVDGNLFVTFGGNHGDCGPYHGWVVGLATATPAVFNAWATSSSHAGIWSQGA